MTDVMGGAGGKKGVGVRLFVEGGELVRKTFDQIGDSGKKMWAELGAGTKAANPALKGVNALADEGKQALEGLADQAGGLGRALSAVGPIGVAMAAAMGGLAIAINRAREAMTWAAELTDQAQALGVSTEALQAYRFASEEAGASAGAMESTLGSLNKVIGALRTGLGDSKFREALAAIGFKPEQIDSLESADQLLLAVADRIAEAGDIAEATKIADALGIDRELIPALMRGSAALTEGTEKARELGIVLEEDLVRGLDAANREVEIANQRIGVEMRRAFLELAPAIAWASRELADFLGDVRAAANSPELGDLRALLGPVGIWAATNGRRERGRGASAPVIGGDLLGAIDAYDASRRRAPVAPPPPPPRAGGGGSRSGGGSSARPAGIKAERYDKIDIVSAEEISRMQLALQLETARIAKNAELIAALERELELRSLIDRYTKMGLSGDDARLSAELDQSTRDAARFADMSGFTDNKADELRESVAALDETRQARIDDMRQVWREGSRAAITGDWKEWLAAQIGEAFLQGVDDVSDQLFNLFLGIFDRGGGAYGMGGSGGGGGFDWLGAIGSVFGLGGSGGSAGGASPAGAGYDGTTGKTVNVTVKLDGARTDREIREVVQQGVQMGVQTSIEETRRNGENWRFEQYQMVG